VVSSYKQRWPAAAVAAYVRTAGVAAERLSGAWSRYVLRSERAALDASTDSRVVTRACIDSAITWYAEYAPRLSELRHVPRITGLITEEQHRNCVRGEPPRLLLWIG
jgi:hypothetical protein